MATVDELKTLREYFLRMASLEQSIEKILEGVEPVLACTVLNTKLIISLAQLPDKQADDFVSTIIKGLQEHQSSGFAKVHQLQKRKEVEKAKSSPAGSQRLLRLLAALEPNRGPAD
jgi:hypothetical protein